MENLGFLYLYALYNFLLCFFGTCNPVTFPWG